MVPYKNKRALRQRFDDLIKWYDEFTGMDAVREAQNKVLEAENSFREAQNLRRTISCELREVQEKIKEVYSDIENTNKGDDRYLTLVTLEHNLLKEEKKILEKFTAAEKDERNCFTNLSNKVKLSHEKERAQGERTKYWSIIGSIIGTIIGILGTSINGHLKMNELRELVKNSSNDNILKIIKHHSEKTEEKFSELTKIEECITDKVVTSNTKIEETLNNISSRLYYVEKKLQNIKPSNFVNEFHEFENTKSDEMNTVIMQINDSVRKEYNNTKILLFGFVILSVILPLVIQYS